MPGRPQRDVSPAHPSGAFEGLFHRYRDPVLAYALRRTNREQAEDAVAETFAVAWRRWGELPDDPLPWLLGVARRVLANQRRSSSRQRALVGKLERQPTALWVEAEPESDLALLLQALRRLPEAEREILMLVAWEGLEPRDAAAVVGQPAALFRLRLHRARKRLRVEIERAERGSPLPTTTKGGASKPSCDPTI